MLNIWFSDENEDDYGNGSDMQYIYMIEESLSNYIEKEMDGQECDLFVSTYRDIYSH